ncbi:MAG: ATP-binding cassette domain-containing protein [Phycisphaerales bacterium]
MAIDVAEADKVYSGKVHALRSVRIAVHRGEVFGLLGPNGAGKSTLVKILMTIVRPTRCRGTMLGRSIGHKPTLSRIGYLPEHHRFPDYLTGRQVLEYFAALSGVGRMQRKKRAGELLDLVGMSRWESHRVRQYSKGMRQRIGVAQSLMNDPDLVLLDEPTDGVDPVGRRDIRNVLTEMKRRGKAVLVNSHLLSELEMVCDRVAIMVQGRVTSQGTIDELTAYGRRYEIEVENPGVKALGAAAGGDGLWTRAAARLPAGVKWSANGETLTVETSDAGSVQGVIDSLRAQGQAIRAVRPLRPTLEELFMLAVNDPATGKPLEPGASA